ncbi:MAG: hypothetical protein ACRYG7_18775 [Janthinobacterium lividum]
MLHSGDLRDLNEEDRSIIMELFQSKIEEAEQSLAVLEEQTFSLKEAIKRWRVFLGTDEPATTETRPTSSNPEFQSVEISEYDKGWSKEKKALYAIANPQVIEKNTIAGGLDILKVLHKLDPELVPSIESQPLRRKYTNLVSTLAWEGKLMKLREKQNKSAVHYVHPNRFENGSLKPQYSYLLEELEPIPQKNKASA